MAEQIPYCVASSLIEKLASAAFHELGRIYGVTQELERLKNTVESIKAVLLDAEERQERDHAVQIWIRRLKDVLHPAEDLLDEFSIQDMRHKLEAGSGSKVKEVFHFLSPTRVAFRREMAHKIEKIRKNFNHVVQEMSQLNLSPRVVVVKQTDSVSRETSSFVLESDIIGRENSKKEIISLLRQSHENQNVSVIAIVGIGGLGKTTLAQLVYNDVEVQNFFEKRIWVCISDNFDVKTIVKKMLESLIHSKDDERTSDKLVLEKLSLDSLQNKVRDHLTGKRYLLVLDDIWNESREKWAHLRTYLMCGAQDSRVLVTTRSKIVAQTMGVSESYVLNGLTSEESWSLLKKITFGDDTRRVNQTLESTGKKIAEKCRGVPLAIRTMGGILQSKSEETEWFGVLQGDFWKLCEEQDNIMPVLKLSYQNLSPQQRQCFAYCSLYPKDWEIEKDELIQLWMAQGYLECSTEGELMEDIGNHFVKIFMMKSFFQDAKINEDGDIFRFKIHDLMHDLAMHVAGNDCCYLDGEEKRLVGRPMHVMLKPNAISLLGSLDASRLRTLILWSDLDNELEKLKEEKLSVISNFKYLRGLRVSHSSLGKLSTSIGKMKHLRYLDLLRCDQLAVLPKSISNLVCLQTLKLKNSEGLEFSTKFVSRLINLRYLNIQGSESIEDNILISLGILTVQSVIYLNRLSSLTNIVKISLSACGSCRYLPPLERLPFLKSLCISYLHELEYIYFEESLPVTFFPSLERLIFMWCGKLRGWCRMGDDFNDVNNYSHHLSFPRLSQLHIIGCQRLICMPNFPNLDKILTLSECSVEPLEATLNIAVDFPPLSMLKSLEIAGNLNIEKLPKDWMQNLTSLEHLKFQGFSSEKFQEIEIWFKDIANCLPSLHKINVEFGTNLKALPDWICNLSSLQQLKIMFCFNLESLPEEMPRLTNLHTLEILGCRLLIKQCQTKTSATWPKIAHIPNIILH